MTAYDRVIGVGVEATPGVPVSVSTFLPEGGITVERGQQFAERLANFQMLQKPAALAAHYLPAISISDVELNAEEGAKLFYWALGSIATTELEAGVVYSHTLSPSSPKPLTLHVLSNAAGQNILGSGFYVNELTVSAAVGEVVKASANFIGLTLTDDYTGSLTPAYSAKAIVATSASVKIAGSEVEVSAFELSLANNLNQRVILNKTEASYVKRTGLLDITGRITFESFPAAEYNRFKSGETAELSIELLGGTIGTGSQEKLQITLPALQYTGGFAREFNNEEFTGEAEFRAALDLATSKIIEVVAVNLLTNAEMTT